MGAEGVRRRLVAIEGVRGAEVNYGAGSVTVRFDEARLSLEALRNEIVQCGYHCRGALAPARVCDEADAPERSLHAPSHDLPEAYA